MVVGTPQEDFSVRIYVEIEINPAAAATSTVCLYTNPGEITLFGERAA
jgi:hypothetical protein